MVTAHGAPHHAVDPASQSVGPFEGVEAGVDHDEDFLDDIVNGVWGDTETPDGGPYEIEVLPVEGLEWRHSGRSKA
jgi:hypothetical protein